MSRRYAAISVGMIVWLAGMGTGRADLLNWRFVADCEPGADHTDLTIRCSHEIGCINKSWQLYGCSGQCGGPDLLGDGLFWQDRECHCTCAIGGEQFACDATPTCTDPYDYFKCSESARAELPLSCDQLGYDFLCTEPTCPAELPSGETWWDSPCGGLYADLSLGKVEASGCATSDPDPGADPGQGCGAGCGVAGLSLPEAKTDVVACFAVVLLLSLLWARRMSH